DKAVQLLSTLLPLPCAPLLMGLRATLFVDDDRSAQGVRRRRIVEQVTFESPRANGGVDRITTRDRSISGHGWSVWLNPRLGRGWEILLRHDDTRPDRTTSQSRIRNVAGVAYWLPSAQKVTTAVLV